MAQRKKDVRDACKFEFTDEEMAVLKAICHVATEAPNYYQIARRFEVFFLNAISMKPGDYVETKLLD